jgi:hypothetical protein
MTIDSGQIHQIVREVLRQLMSQQTDANGVSATSVVPAIGPCASPDTLVVTERIVSAELLRGRLTGVRCIQIPERAIVTPLVADLLRGQSIRLERMTAARQPQPALRQRWGWLDEPLAGHDGASRCAPPSLAGIAWLDFSDRKELLARLIPSGSSEPLPRAVAVTGDWARLVCEANRHGAVRAAAVASAQCVDQAIGQLDPNLLVINRWQCPAEQVATLVDRFRNRTMATNR